MSIATASTLDCIHPISEIESALCEKENEMQLSSQLSMKYHELLQVLDDKAVRYDEKYKDAFFDNYEMPYKEIKIELIKSQALWEQFVESECRLFEKIYIKKNESSLPQHQCMEDQLRKRLLKFEEFLTKIIQD